MYVTMYACVCLGVCVNMYACMTVCICLSALHFRFQPQFITSCFRYRRLLSSVSRSVRLPRSSPLLSAGHPSISQDRNNRNLYSHMSFIFLFLSTSQSLYIYIYIYIYYFRIPILTPIRPFTTPLSFLPSACPSFLPFFCPSLATGLG